MTHWETSGYKLMSFLAEEIKKMEMRDNVTLGYICSKIKAIDSSESLKMIGHFLFYSTIVY